MTQETRWRYQDAAELLEHLNEVEVGTADWNAGACGVGRHRLAIYANSLLLCHRNYWLS